MWRFRTGKAACCTGSFADVRHEGHETGPLDRVLDGALEGGAVAAPLAAEELALAGAHLLETLHVLVIHERRPRAAFLRAEAASILAALAQFLANHSDLARNSVRFGKRSVYPCCGFRQRGE